MNPFKLAELSYRTRMQGVDPQGGMNLMSEAELNRRRDEAMRRQWIEFVEAVIAAAKTRGITPNEADPQFEVHIYWTAGNVYRHDEAGVYVQAHDWDEYDETREEGLPRRIENFDFDAALRRVQQLPASADKRDFWRALIGHESAG